MVFRRILLLCLFAVSCEAALEWPQKEVLLPLDSSQSEGTTAFSFTNTGTTTATITSVKPGCGCTSYSLDKKSVQPGESGILNVVFSVGDRKGSYHVPIDVKTDVDPDATQLSLIAHIRELVKVVPLFLQWQSGDAHTAKRIELYWDKTANVKLAEVASSDARFKVTVEPATEWTGAIVTIIPPDQANTFTILTVRTRQGESARERVYTIVARVF